MEPVNLSIKQQSDAPSRSSRYAFLSFTHTVARLQQVGREHRFSLWLKRGRAAQFHCETDGFTADVAGTPQLDARWCGNAFDAERPRLRAQSEMSSKRNWETNQFRRICKSVRQARAVITMARVSQTILKLSTSSHLPFNRTTHRRDLDLRPLARFRDHPHCLK